MPFTVAVTGLHLAPTMADIDMSLDDIIQKDGSASGSQRSEGGGGVRRSGRAAPTLSALSRGGSTGIIRGGRPERGAARRAQGTRARSTPYARKPTGVADGDHMAQASLPRVFPRCHTPFPRVLVAIALLI